MSASKTLILFLALILSTTVPGIVCAQEGEAAQARKRIEALLREAEELQKAGKPDRASVVQRQAQELKQRLARYEESRKNAQRDEPKRNARRFSDDEKRNKLIQQVFTAAEALQALGRGEAAERLAAIGRELVAKEKRDQPRKGDDRPKRTENKERQPTEREVARRHLEIMRLALPALKEADRKDTVAILERSIRAREVALEGRRDKEAEAIRKQAPPLAHDIEVLLYASKLWREFGNDEKAEVVGKLGKHLGEIYRKQRQKEQPDGRKRD